MKDGSPVVAPPRRVARPVARPALRRHDQPHTLLVDLPRAARDLDAADLRQAAIEEVALNGATTQIVEYQGSRPHGFVVHALRREYFFAAEDADEQVAWVREIARACARVVLLLGGAKLSPLPSSPPSSIATPMLAATPTDARSPILAAAAAPSFDDVDFDDGRLMATAAAAFVSAAARRAWNGWARARRGGRARARGGRRAGGERAATRGPRPRRLAYVPPTRRARARVGSRCHGGGAAAAAVGTMGRRGGGAARPNRDGAQGGRRLSLLRAPPGLHHVGGNRQGAGRSSRARATRSGGDEPARPPRCRQRVARGGGEARRTELTALVRRGGDDAPAPPCRQWLAYGGGRAQGGGRRCCAAPPPPYTAERRPSTRCGRRRRRRRRSEGCRASGRLPPSLQHLSRRRRGVGSPSPSARARGCAPGCGRGRGRRRQGRSAAKAFRRRSIAAAFAPPSQVTGACGGRLPSPHATTRAAAAAAAAMRLSERDAPSTWRATIVDRIQHVRADAVARVMSPDRRAMRRAVRQWAESCAAVAAGPRGGGRCASGQRAALNRWVEVRARRRGRARGRRARRHGGSSSRRRRRRATVAAPRARRGRRARRASLRLARRRRGEPRTRWAWRGWRDGATAARRRAEVEAARKRSIALEEQNAALAANMERMKRELAPVVATELASRLEALYEQKEDLEADLAEVQAEVEAEKVHGDDTGEASEAAAEAAMIAEDLQAVNEQIAEVEAQLTDIAAAHGGGGDSTRSDDYTRPMRCRRGRGPHRRLRRLRTDHPSTILGGGRARRRLRGGGDGGGGGVGGAAAFPESPCARARWPPRATSSRRRRPRRQPVVASPPRPRRRPPTRR